MRRASLWPFVLVFVLLAALAAFAMLQVRWIDQALAAEERRVRDGMEQASRRVSEEAMRELFTVPAAFDLKSAGAGDVSLRYDRWRSVARDPRLIREIYVLESNAVNQFDLHDRLLKAVDTPLWVEPVRRAIDNHERFALTQRPLAFVLPAGASNLVIVLDEQRFFGGFIGDLARRSFGDGFDVAIARDDALLYRSSTAVSRENADMARPLLMLMRRDRRMASPPVERASFTLLARHRGQSLAETFRAKRVRDLSVAAGVLSILAVSLVILAWAARRADQLRRRQLEFIAGVTHELHTPLAAVAAAGQNLADGVDVDTAAYGHAIVKEARRLSDLVDEVLAFSGMEAGRVAPRADVDVRDVLREAVARAGADLRTESDRTPMVFCDRDALMRAIQNLVTNAMRHGGGAIDVRSFADNGHVVIRVDDRGAGIAPEDLPHLFEPFYRGRNAQVRGSGLGLAIVDRFARAHGGSIVAENRRDGGASFTLRLPVRS
jgi:signal transduction histidine kinase